MSATATLSGWCRVVCVAHFEHCCPSSRPGFIFELRVPVLVLMRALSLHTFASWMHSPASSKRRNCFEVHNAHRREVVWTGGNRKKEAGQDKEVDPPWRQVMEKMGARMILGTCGRIHLEGNVWNHSREPAENSNPALSANLLSGFVIRCRRLRRSAPAL